MDGKRIDLYKQIEEMQGSKVITYVTSDRVGMESQIANDVTEYFIEHLDEIGSEKKISLILHTNGGSTSAAWNIVNLIKQFCDEFEVIVPVKAWSAGTLISLGANSIIMTKQATLGPIDPSVNTPLNPKIENGGPLARVPVSVEAIKGYLDFAKSELKIKDDNALADIFVSLTDKVHPLVLGEVNRAIGQIRMLAEKLLRSQITDVDKINKIISFLCSESGSHDYTINRREAQETLGLKIEKPSQELYEAIKGVYGSIKEELELGKPFDPAGMIGANSTLQYNAKRAIIESVTGGQDAFVSQGILSRINTSQPQNVINDQRIYEGWKHYDL